MGGDYSVTIAPRTIDGARVLSIADLSDARPLGTTRHVVNGLERTEFAALAIAQYDTNPGFYLFYCDGDWKTITDTYHDTIEDAVAQARFEFGPIAFSDVNQ
jgi:hypothetical protein